MGASYIGKWRANAKVKALEKANPHFNSNTNSNDSSHAASSSNTSSSYDNGASSSTFENQTSLTSVALNYEINAFEHKVWHGLLGGTIAGLRPNGNFKENFLAGAFGAVASETIADLYMAGSYDRALKAAAKNAKDANRPLQKQDIQEALTDEIHEAGKWAKLGALCTGTLLGLDPNTVDDAAQNAINNNLLVQGLMGVFVLGSTAWSAYEVWDAYHKAGGGEEGAKAALKQLGIEVATAVVGGIAAKGVAKGASMGVKAAKKTKAGQAAFKAMETKAVSALETLQNIVNDNLLLKLAFKNTPLSPATAGVGAGVNVSTNVAVNTAERASVKTATTNTAKPAVTGTSSSLPKKTTGSSSSAPRTNRVNKGSHTDAKQEAASASNMTVKRNQKGRVQGVTNTQNHHVIHQKLESHPLWEKAGMDVETSLNKMFLPTKEGAEISTTTRSIHQGRHKKAIERDLEMKMNKVYEQGHRHGYTTEQYQAKLTKIIQKERALLKSGDRALNSVARPWANQ